MNILVDRRNIPPHLLPYFEPVQADTKSVFAISPRGFDGEFCTACRRYFDGPEKARIKVVPDESAKYSAKYAQVDSRNDTERMGRQGAGGVADQVERTPTVRICPCGRSDAWLSHFATFPEDLVLPMVKAATSEVGCCAACGAPWERVVRVERRPNDRPQQSWSSEFGQQDSSGGLVLRRREVVGWQPTCGCDVNRLTPAVVLDTFTGAGTTAMVALKAGRSFVGAELNRDYADMAAARVRADAPLFNEVTVVETA